ncbi:unnamed protein product [Sphacelaria rigidula]
MVQLQGLRQEYPLACVLYNIFGNNITEGIAGGGVNIPIRSAPPRVQRPVGGPGPVNVEGLMFADDLCIPTATRWARDNGMAVGINKCGIIVVGKSIRVLRKEPERYQISGEAIPIVDSYKYLGDQIPGRHGGLPINGWPSRADTVTGEQHGAVLEVQDHPHAHQDGGDQGGHPRPPRLLFGAEIYGMRADITQKMQTLLNQAFRVSLGMDPKICAPSVALWREVGIPPVVTTAAARRALAMKKCDDLRTWIKVIKDVPFQHNS